jgi:hypothetical protein
LSAAFNVLLDPPAYRRAMPTTKRNRVGAADGTDLLPQAEITGAPAIDEIDLEHVDGASTGDVVRADSDG